MGLRATGWGLADVVARGHPTRAQRPSIGDGRMEPPSARRSLRSTNRKEICRDPAPLLVSRP